MMSRRGHEIIHYGHRNSKVECAELVSVVEPETYDTLYGNVHDIRKNQYVTHGDDHPLYALISGNTIYEISKRKRPGDYLLIFGGFWNKKIADAHGDMIVVEPAIGYPASFSNFKVYPSYAYLHSFVTDSNLPVNHYHVVIPHYFDIDDFDPCQPKEDYFLFVGRLNFDKGITLAIQLTEKIGARLKVCGQGSLQSLGYDKVPDHVDLIGYVGVEKRKELMAKAKCVIMPTIYMEPFGCVAIESLLSGTPLLTHDWGGPGENNIHGVTGFKCRTFEQFEWAARNIHLINPKNCREWAEKNFSFDKVGLMYEDYFQSLQGGVDWYRPNPTRTNLDHLKKEYPIALRESSVTMTPNGIFETDPDDICIHKHLQTGEVYESYIINGLLKPYIEKSKYIVDVGANIGCHTISYANMNLTCKVWAFEPQAQLFGILSRNVTRNNLGDRINIYKCGLGHKETATTLYSLDKEWYPDQCGHNKGGLGIGQGGESINICTLDSLNLQGLDFMKIDVEGAEGIVLQGAAETIKKYKPVIFFEHNDKRIDPKVLGLEYVPTPFEVLAKLGYTSFKLIAWDNYITEG
jgi:FkbM family methyltransferase